MTKHLRGLAVRTEGKAVTFLASTDTDQASDGLVISKDAWDLSRFLKTGAPVMWSHRYDLPPIGTASNVRVTDQGLVMDVAFDETSGDDLARTIAAKVRSGVINACSVGFDVIEQVGARVKKARLIELSVVSIGADPNALALARSAFACPRPSKISGPPPKLTSSELLEVANYSRMNAAERRRFLDGKEGNGIPFLVRALLASDDPTQKARIDLSESMISTLAGMPDDGVEFWSRRESDSFWKGKVRY